MKLIIREDLKLKKLGVYAFQAANFGWLVKHRKFYAGKYVLDEHRMYHLIWLLEQYTKFDISEVKVSMLSEITLEY